MATNKNQVPIINEEGIEKALKAFKSIYKAKKEHYEEEGVKMEDVIILTRDFSGKSAAFAANVILSIMIAMPPEEFIALIDITKSLYKVKLLESIKETLKEDIKGADNNIDN